MSDERLRELIAKWRKEQADYPVSPEGLAASAAVRLCSNELEAALAAPAEPAVRASCGCTPAVISPTCTRNHQGFAWVGKPSERPSIAPDLAEPAASEDRQRVDR